MCAAGSAGSFASHGEERSFALNATSYLKPRSWPASASSETGAPVKTVLAGTSQVSGSAAPAGASVRPVSSAALTVIGAMNFRVRF